MSIRHGTPFSVLVVTPPPGPRLRARTKAMASALLKSIREIDEIGLCRARAVEVLLTGADHQCTHAVVERLNGDLEPDFGRVEIRTFSYDVRHPPPQPLQSVEALFPRWKRAMDLVGASLAIFITLPVLAAIALLIRLGSGGPVFFRQERLGYLGQPFRIWKFRTMEDGGAESEHALHIQDLLSKDKPLQKIDKDIKLIPFGRVLRESALDELPQMFNVISGEMSLVGPRPDVTYALSSYEGWQRARLLAVPGMTGLWQVSGKNKMRFSEMVRLDLRYLNQMSLGGDLMILIKTVWVVIESGWYAVAPKRHTEPPKGPAEVRSSHLRRAQGKDADQQ